jgi:hypothetical protein
VLRTTRAGAVIIRSVNEGEVYRFIKKPWDNVTLRVIVYFAFETIQLADENRRLLAAVRRQLAVLREMARQYPAVKARTHDEEEALQLAQEDLLGAARK